MFWAGRQHINHSREITTENNCPPRPHPPAWTSSSASYLAVWTPKPSTSLLSHLIACWPRWIPILSPVRVPHLPGTCHLCSCDEKDEGDHDELPHMDSWTQWTHWDQQSVGPKGSTVGAWNYKNKYNMLTMVNTNLYFAGLVGGWTNTNTDMNKH